jgi:hypothetical protein
MMNQELAPTQTGAASAWLMGFAWRASGLLFVPLFPLAGFFLALKLPQ